MKLINYDGIAYLPHFILKTDMLDFENTEYDDENIIIPFKPEVQDDLYFEHIKEILKNKITEFYFEESFEDCEEKYSLIVWNTEYGYEFKIQVLINGCDQYLEVRLNNDEFQIIEPIIGKAFGSNDISDEFANIRIQVANTFKGNISKPVLDKLKLNSEKFFGNSYRSAWITEDNQACVFAKIEDVQDKNCPIQMVKFGC